MRVLILGGTRFLGRQLAEALVAGGHDLTVLSRRPGGAPAGARQVCAERSAGLAALKGSRFDLVLDFICYDGAGPAKVMDCIAPERYVLVSSAWLPRLWSGRRADQPCPADASPPSDLPAVTLNYLSGKMRAEQATAGLHDRGRDAVVLRLPIVLGAGDHTGRMNFYPARFADGGPVIAVGGGGNQAQIAVMEDLAEALALWLERSDIGRFPIWEGLPGEGHAVRSILERMAGAMDVRPTLVAVPAAELARDLPAYLEQEPFWRESALAPTEANIYAAAGRMPALFGATMPPLPAAARDSGLRAEELRFLANRQSH